MKIGELVKQKSWVAGVSLLLAFCWANSAAAQDENKWQFEATIYGWYTEIDGTVKHPGGTIPGGPFEVDASDIIDNLEMVFMGTFEVRKNKWSLIADAIYLGIGADKNISVKSGSGIPVHASVDLDLSAWVLSGLVGYDVVQSEKVTLAVVGGARYAMIDVDVDLSLMGLQGSGRSDSEGLLDGVVGVRGFISLSEHWYLPYYADVGAGGSDLTWQALGGIGYQFGWGDIKLVYRYLSYDMDDGGLLKDLSVSGPALGIGFRF